MDMNWIPNLREEGRVFRTAVEKGIAAELAAQSEVAAETGKTAGLQTIEEKGLKALATVLTGMAKVLPTHGQPATDSAAKAIDRFSTDLLATANDLRALADGSLAARTPAEMEEAAAATTAAEEALAAAQEEVARLNRHSARLS